MENVAIEQEISPITPLPTGPLEKVYVIWLAGMSCDGCSISLLGATTPPLERLMAGTVPGVPKLVVSHTALSLESGHEYLETFFKAERGELDAPYVVVLEGSVPDEKLAGKTGGYFVAVGEENGRQVPTAEWLTRLTPTAAAVISVGTCACWGGIPAAYGNATGSMSLMEYLGKDFRSAFGLPVINI
ncbi:MAG: hydrogenase expression protein HypE, partial [Nitrospinaceae bacterium]